MRNRTAIVILVLVCLGLGIAAIYIKRQATYQHREDAATIMTLSNKWTDATMKWEDVKQESAGLRQDLDKAEKQHASVAGELSNNLSQVNATLQKTAASLKATESTLAEAQAELKKNQDRVSELENANAALDRQANELSLSITNLTVQIAETRRKLETAEGDRALLERELKKLMADKAELERQFNDLVVVRAQVAKLKEELNIARRIAWIRQGIFAASEQKGAQRLVQGLSAPEAKPNTNNFDLNVELKTDGSVKVTPATTNTVAQ